MAVAGMDGAPSAGVPVAGRSITRAPSPVPRPRTRTRTWTWTDQDAGQDTWENKGGHTDARQESADVPAAARSNASAACRNKQSFPAVDVAVARS
ncbi:hypothetical protein GCM10023075_44070 [Streptosporangium album]